MKVFSSFLLYCLFQVKCALSIDCFNCHSTNYRTCDSYQKQKSCSGKEQQCYSLRYVDIIDGQVEDHGFKKGCVDARHKNCDSICVEYFKQNYKKCKVSCCEGNLCNQNGFQDLDDASTKSKRTVDKSIEDRAANSANGCYNMLTFIYNLLVLIVLRLILP